MKTHMKYLATAVALALAGISGAALAANAPEDVTRATLDNGLRVVIVHDDLAPVVTTQMNYLAGADQTPAGFPGTAHAMEHMMFRGSPGLDKDQLLAIASNMGGSFNANTQHGVTQYYFTVPAQDLDVALRVASIRMRGVDVTKKGWSRERGAIEQEVSRDMSNPGYKFMTQMNAHMFAGTPYAHTGLGTRESFDKTTAAALKKFHDTWYAPNNAILVIAGDVDPAATMSTVKSLFGDIARKDLPSRPAFHFKPMQAKTIQLPTDYPVGLVALAWRMPGLRDKDHATALVLSRAMASKRGELFAMGLNGKALSGGFGSNFMPRAGIGFAQAAFPRGGDAHKVLDSLRGIIADAASNGVPVELVKAAKRTAIADMEYKKNSVSGLANAWSAALANRGARSPDDLREAIAAVTPQDVDALAKRLFDPAHAVTAILTPESSGKPASRSGFGGAESFGGEPAGKVKLPAWAESAFTKRVIPEPASRPASFTLDNGLRVIVQPESVSRTVEVFGQIKTNADMQAAKGKEGIDDLLDAMFNFGTRDMDRLQFQAALDAISAHESAGSGFSLAVPSDKFAQGMKLLADNELHPAMPEQAFAIMRKNQSGAMAGQLQSPGFLDSMHMLKALLPDNDPGLRHATPETIGKLTLDDVKAYYRKTFRPDMTTIVVIGDTTADEVRKVVEQTFGAWRAQGRPPETDYPAVPLNKADRFNTPDASAVQDSVTLAEMVDLTEDDPDRYALYLGNEVLGGGFHSMLMRDLRSRNGLVYGVSSGVSLDKHRGRFSISFGSDPDKVDKARALVLRDIRQMQARSISADDLHAAKGKMLRQLQLGQSSFEAVAGNLLALSLAGKPLDSADIAAHRYDAMTADEVRAAFKKYLRPDAFVMSVKGPAAKH